MKSSSLIEPNETKQLLRNSRFCEPILSLFILNYSHSNRGVRWPYSSTCCLFIIVQIVKVNLPWSIHPIIPSISCDVRVHPVFPVHDVTVQQKGFDISELENRRKEEQNETGKRVSTGDAFTIFVSHDPIWGFVWLNRHDADHKQCIVLNKWAISLCFPSLITE